MLSRCTARETPVTIAPNVTTVSARIFDNTLQYTMQTLKRTDRWSILHHCDEYVHHVLTGEDPDPYHVIKHLGRQAYRERIGRAGGPREHITQYCICRAAVDDRHDLVDTIVLDMDWGYRILMMITCITLLDAANDGVAVISLLKYMFSDGYQYDYPRSLADAIYTLDSIDPTDLLSHEILGRAISVPALEVLDMINRKTGGVIYTGHAGTTPSDAISQASGFLMRQCRV